MVAKQWQVKITTSLNHQQNLLRNLNEQFGKAKVDRK